MRDLSKAYAPAVEAIDNKNKKCRHFPATKQKQIYGKHFV